MKFDEQFGNEIEMRISSEFESDLKQVYTAVKPVPPEVDSAVLDRARHHFTRRGKLRYRLIRACTAAAAAILIFVLLVNRANLTSDTVQVRPSVNLKAVMANEDIDASGRVDILDAFKLAKHIESAEKIESKWDINGDGLVDKRDVDFIASAAVLLERGTL
ncbi:MAG: hypothetical protein E4H40_01010 [Candidatus Brocadiia bacterium]|nr:MAG: hypothetical protein E4H40_01010 [Candidatus Brocadiia bacterium]